MEKKRFNLVSNYSPQGDQVRTDDFRRRGQVIQGFGVDCFWLEYGLSPSLPMHKMVGKHLRTAKGGGLNGIRKVIESGLRESTFTGGMPDDFQFLTKPLFFGLLYQRSR